jgi:hypothetical protein
VSELGKHGSAGRWDSDNPHILNIYALYYNKNETNTITVQK